MAADYEKRSWLYIDGFNFYYAIKNSDLPKGLAWCDLRLLGEQFLIREGSRLERIRYFTAPVKQYSVEYGEAGRQQIWLKAVSTIKGLDKIEGIHMEHHQKPRSEKMTDVNIAVELILDALDPNGYDQAVLVSGDLDLIPAAVAVMSRIPQPREIEFWIPPNLNHKRLKRYCERHGITCNEITPRMLFKSRFPDEIPAKEETIKCLEMWKLPKNLKQYGWAR